MLGGLLAILLLLAPPAAKADYDSAKVWFERQDYDDRIFLQLHLILTGDYIGLADGIFGRNTYNALISYQREMRYRQNGILSAKQVDALKSRAAGVYRDLGIELTDDTAAQVSLPIPTSVVSGPRPTNRGSGWSSRNRDIEIETVSVPAYEQSYFEVYSKMITETRSRRVSYSSVQYNFFVVSGTIDGRRFYLKFHDEGSHTKGFSISWSAKADLLGERLAVLLASLMVPEIKGAPATADSASTPRQSEPKSKTQSAGATVGSGFFVSDEGFVLTNSHVVENCTSIKVQQYPTARVSVLGRDAENDLAILRLNGVSVREAARIRKTSPSLGERVVIAGFPRPDLMGNDLQIHSGIVNATGGALAENGVFSVTARMQNGNSGGPVLDKHGSVIGVVRFKFDETVMLQNEGAALENYNFAIRSDVLLDFLSPYKGVKTLEEHAELSVETIAAKSADFTVQIVCSRN